LYGECGTALFLPNSECNSKEKMNVTDSMKETSSLKGTKLTATKVAQLKLVSVLKRTRIFIDLWLRNKIFPYIMSPRTVLFGSKAGMWRVTQ
jgi:hypothetical protein